MIDALDVQSGDAPQVVLEMGAPQAPKLMDRLRAVLEGRHFAPAMVEHYVEWGRRLILFYDKRHPQDMGAKEVNEFFA